jgi:hypothetical protein
VQVHACSEAAVAQWSTDSWAEATALWSWWGGVEGGRTLWQRRQAEGREQPGEAVSSPKLTAHTQLHSIATSCPGAATRRRPLDKLAAVPDSDSLQQLAPWAAPAVSSAVDKFIAASPSLAGFYAADKAFTGVVYMSDKKEQVSAMRVDRAEAEAEAKWMNTARVPATSPKLAHTQLRSVALPRGAATAQRRLMQPAAAADLGWPLQLGIAFGGSLPMAGAAVFVAYLMASATRYSGESTAGATQQVAAARVERAEAEAAARTGGGQANGRGAGHNKGGAGHNKGGAGHNKGGAGSSAVCLASSCAGGCLRLCPLHRRSCHVLCCIRCPVASVPRCAGHQVCPQHSGTSHGQATAEGTAQLQRPAEVGCCRRLHPRALCGGRSSMECNAAQLCVRQLGR